MNKQVTKANLFDIHMFILVLNDEATATRLVEEKAEVSLFILLKITYFN